MTDQLLKVVMDHLHDLTHVQDRQFQPQAVEMILPPIMVVVWNDSVNGPQFGVVWRAVCDEFIVQLLRGDSPGLESDQPANDAMQEVKHSGVNIEDQTYIGVGENKMLKAVLAMS
jgi:hypothetical protein